MIIPNGRKVLRMELNEKDKILYLLEGTLEETIESTHRLYQSIKCIRQTDDIDEIYKTFQSMIDYFAEQKKKYVLGNVIPFQKR